MRKECIFIILCSCSAGSYKEPPILTVDSGGTEQPNIDSFSDSEDCKANTIKCPQNACGAWNWCGFLVECPNLCVLPETCGGGDKPFVCGCTPKSFDSVCSNKDCGIYPDGCGGYTVCSTNPVTQCSECQESMQDQGKCDKNLFAFRCQNGIVPFGCSDIPGIAGLWCCQIW